MIMKENIILTKTFEFSLKIIKYCELLHEQKKFVISNQLLKSGTSIGANIREAQNSESRNDFIHKFKISAKEIEETNYWLLLCKHSESYPSCDELIEKLKEIENITNKIIITSKISGRR
ncbi:four helix bundle protein [Chryseobacterium sp. IHB B 17019]|nr:four helix bundle protein [Chryseobacterium sp. IHB B 17019]